MRLLWLSDIHLNSLKKQQFVSFLRDLQNEEPDALLITGDIAEAPTLCDYLFMVDLALQTPIYFVLGNHDFYHGSIARTRASIDDLTRDSKHLVYLTGKGVVQLSPTTCLVGHDSWADGRLGDYANSDVEMNDFLLIEDLAGLDHNRRRDKLNQLGDEAAAYLGQVLPDAARSAETIIVATHVPPFREACWHDGSISSDDYLPHYSCGAVGQVLQDAARSWPDRQFKVFCGHTHGAGHARIADNLEVFTAGAEYGKPAAQRIIECQ